MGVPLEEMDAVFGEGTIKFLFLPSLSLINTLYPGDLQEFYENQESEQVSLVGNISYRRSATRRPPSPSFLQLAREWFNSVANKSRDRSAYEPLRGDE